MNYYSVLLYSFLFIYFLLLPLDGLTINYLPVTLSRIFSIPVILIFIYNLLLKKKIHFLKDHTSVLLVAFSYYSMISLFWSKQMNFLGTVSFLFHVVVTLAIIELVISNKLKSRKIIFAYLLGCIVASVIAINTGKVYFGRYTIHENYNPNTFSGEIVIGIAIVFYLWEGRKKVGKFILVSVLVMLLLLLILTQSRNAILAVILGVLFILLMNLLITATRINFARVIRNGVTIIFLLGIVTIMIIALVEILSLDAHSFRRLTSSVDLSNPELTNGRNVIWKNYLQIIKDYFIIGTGFLSGSLVYSDYYGLALQPHNSYIRVFAELGLIGFLIYVSFIIGLASKVTSFSEGNKGKFAFSFIIIFMIFSGFGNDSLFYSYYWTGLVIALLIFIQNKYTSNSSV